MTTTIDVPASSANLGPGFDVLGLALALYDRIEVEPAGHITGDITGDITVDVDGEGAESLPRDGSHLVVRAILATLDALGHPVPGFALRCHNAIPHARGLGSSAAAAVAGVAAGYALAGVELDQTERAGRALDLAAAFDGHADNAAASLLGGLVLAWHDGSRFHAERLRPHPDIAPVLLVPAVESSTEQARGLLPAHVPHADAVFNVGRAALAVHAFTAAPELLMTATGDRLHQPYRRDAHPASAALVDALRAAGVPAAVSGAGPTVLALTSGDPLPDEVDLTGFDAVAIPVDVRGVHLTT